jgi:DNA-binding PadR family transcriptional regulator
MIDDKYLRILAAIYSISRQNPTRRGVHSPRVGELLNMDYQDLVPAIRYLESSHLLSATWGGSHSALVDLTAAGTDYVERPLDTLRSVERPLTQTNTINVGGDFNAIESTIVQMNIGPISDSDIQLALEGFDKVVRQLPPDVVAASQDLLPNRDSLAAKLGASDRLGAAGVISSLAKVVTIAKDSAVLIQTLPIIYNGIRLLFHLP